MIIQRIKIFPFLLLFIIIFLLYIFYIKVILKNKHVCFPNNIMAKIISILRSCSMKIFSKFPTVNISKLNCWLVICIAKNFIWTTLKVIFSIFRFSCTLRFQIYKYCFIITNHTSMERLFIQLSDDVYISISQNWPLWLVLCSRVDVNDGGMTCSAAVLSRTRLWWWCTPRYSALTWSRRDSRLHQTPSWNTSTCAADKHENTLSRDANK